VSRQYFLKKSKHSPPSRGAIVAAALACLLLAFALTGPSAALQAKKAQPGGNTPQSSSRATKEAAPANSGAAKATTPPRPRIDTLAQQQFLATEEWKTTASDFEQWLNTQMFYDEERTTETRARFAVGVERMSAEQLQTFMVGLQAKLEILYSTLAQDAETYLIEKAAVASAAYMKRIRDKMPDVLTASAAQINQQLVALAAHRQSRRDTQQRFDDSRQQRVVANQARLQQRQEAHARSVERRGRAPGVVSSKAENDFQPARDYAPHNRDPGGFGIPGMMGFGVGPVGVVW
jgi:hypothetical protein